LEAKASFNSAGSARLENFLARLSAIPEGAEIVNMLKERGVALCFDTEREVGAYTNIVFGHTNGRNITYQKFEIFLCDKSDDDMALQALIHESQHVRHHANGLGNPEFERTLEQECLLRRFQEADAQVKATETCWLLKQAGDPGPFKAAENSIYADMCAAYEAAITASGDRIAARRAAFDAWFDDDRLSFYDYNTLLNNAGAVACLTKDLAPAEEQAAAAQLAAVIRNIGALPPGGANYLNMPGGCAMDTPAYARAIAENLAEGRLKMKAESETQDAPSPAAAPPARRTPRRAMPALAGAA
jgi:hypothetical protein